jgi:hypothetical protein
MKKEILALILANRHKLDRSLMKKILIAAGLLNLNTWLSTPIAENTGKIIKSCFQVSTANQQNDSCWSENEKNSI